MAMNRQRRTANISNIFSYDDAGNIVIKDYSQVVRYSWNGTLHGFIGQLSVSSVSAAVTDTDKFLVSDGGVLKYRTGAEVLSDIGGQPVLTNPVTGTGAAGQVAYWNGTSSQTGSATLTYTPTTSLLVNNSVTAASLIARGTNLTPTLVASANNDVLVGLDIAPTFTNGAFSGVSNYAARLQNKAIISVSSAALLNSGNTYALEINQAGINFNIGATANVVALQSFVGKPISINSQGNNVIIGSTTDSGQRLQVQGTTRLNGVVTIPSTQSINIYNTADETTNTEFVRNYWQSNVYKIEFNKSGSGSFRDLEISAGGGFLIIRGSASNFAGRITASYPGVGSGGIFGITGTISGSGSAFVYSSSILTQVTNSGTVPYSALWVSPFLSSLGTGFNALLDVGTNSAANGGGTHTRYFAVLNNGNAILQNGGTFTDAGFRLDVNGTARVSGQWNVTGSTTASGAIARGAYYTPTLVAAANNDVLVGLDINPTFTNGAFTGVSNAAIRINSDNGIYPFIIRASSSSNNLTISRVNSTNNPTIDITASFININSTNTLIGSGILTPFIREFNGGGNIGFRTYATNTTIAQFFSSTGNLLIQNGGTFTDAGFRLDVNGTARVSGELTVNTVNIGLGGGAVTTNTRVGVSALDANTTGNSNTAIGYQALQNGTTHSSNVAIGSQSMVNSTTSSSNVAIGIQSGYSNNSGGNNVYIGRVAAYFALGSNNTILGSIAGQNISTGDNNVIIGFTAGRFISGGSTALTNADTSIFIGTATKALGNTQTNQIVIGYQETGLGSNTTIIGNSSTITTALRGNLLLGTTTDAGYRCQITSASADTHLNVWGASAPSIRIDNAASGATQRFVFGLATATNNFITGAVAGDICMTTQSSNPLLFGANALEVMRITTSRNLLIGTAIDSGERLIVDGTTRLKSYTGIGINADASTMLYVQGSGTTSADFSAVFQNSNFDNLMKIHNNGKINMGFLPTSSAGLASGDIWNNGGVLNIV